jgi:hypothetical protein
MFSGGLKKPPIRHCREFLHQYGRKLSSKRNPEQIRGKVFNMMKR